MIAETDHFEKQKGVNALLQGIRLRDRFIKKEILENWNYSILASELGYRFDPFHQTLIDHQNDHTCVLDLDPRGWGKSTVGTILSAVMEIIQDRDVRILFASETVTQAQQFLSEVKRCLVNKRLVELFGDFKGDIWHESAINVSKQKTARKEHTIDTTGVDGAVTGFHFDIIYFDDLVSLKNSRTDLQRVKVRQWFYTTLTPCVIDENTKMRGRGTRYHPEDLYAHLMEHDPKFRDSTLIVPALNPETGESNNPDSFSTEFLLQQKESMGSVYFEAQYNQNPAGIQGEIFDDKFFRYVKEFPGDLLLFQGVDLAVGEKDQHDKFAVVTIGVDRKTLNIYVLDYYAGKLSVTKQNEKILSLFEKYDPIATGIESNAFQASKIKSLRENPKFAHIRALPIFTDKDKITRAQLLAVRFERGEIFFRKSEIDGELSEQLLSFPNGRYKDLFDALDIAIKTAFGRRKKKRVRHNEPGIIGSKSNNLKRSRQNGF